MHLVEKIDILVKLAHLFNYCCKCKGGMSKSDSQIGAGCETVRKSDWGGIRYSQTVRLGGM
jgi:hypothetical protein